MNSWECKGKRLSDSVVAGFVWEIVQLSHSLGIIEGNNEAGNGEYCELDGECKRARKRAQTNKELSSSQRPRNVIAVSIVAVDLLEEAAVRQRSRSVSVGRRPIVAAELYGVPWYNVPNYSVS